MSERLEALVPVFILLSVLFMGFLTLKPFVPALLWALTLGVALAPLHTGLENRLWGRRALATLVTTLLMLLFLLLPIIGLSRAMIAFVPDILHWVDGLALAPKEGQAGLSLNADNLLSRDLELVWATIRSDIVAIQGYFGAELRPFAVWLLGEGRVLGTFVLEFALGILVASILMHHQQDVRLFLRQFFLRAGGPGVLQMAIHAGNTIRSTFLAVLLAAAAQAAVASVAYIVSGVPHWAILCALTFLLAMFQIGPILIWIPIAIWLVQGGQPGLAVFVCVWGLVAVGLTDNLVRTVFVSKTSKVPGILAFLGAIGGLVAWGIVGVFLGPVIVAVCHKIAIEWVAGPKQQVQPGET